MFFSYYMICYMIMWLATVYLGSDLLDLFIPCVIAILIDLVKHSTELSRNDNLCCGCGKIKGDDSPFNPLFDSLIWSITGFYLGCSSWCRDLYWKSSFMSPSITSGDHEIQRTSWETETSHVVWDRELDLYHTLGGILKLLKRQSVILCI